MGLDHIQAPPYADLYFVILVVEIIIGTLTNGFIVLVNLRDWLRGQSLNSSDHLVVSLAISNTCFSFANGASIVCFIYVEGIVFLDFVFYILYGVLTYAIFSSSWLSSWLCLFFFLKIISFKGGCLAWMKMKVGKLVPWLIFLSQVMSFISALPFIWTTTKLYSSSTDIGANQTFQASDLWPNQTFKALDLTANQTFKALDLMADQTFKATDIGSKQTYQASNLTANQTLQASDLGDNQTFQASDLVANQTFKLIGYKINDAYSFFSIIVNCFVPFLIVTATTGRIIASLSLHAHHMKQNMEDSRGASLKVHQAAARTMSSLLVIYLIFYMVELGLAFFSMSSPLYWVCFMLILFFPTLQSIVLITGNSKLRKICSAFINCKKKP